MKQRIAKEMLRVLKPLGIILWYDFHMNNPRNPDVRGVKKKEIYELFPDCDIRLKRVTLAPPLARAIAPYSWLACYILEKIPLLRTHYLGVIRKR
jgi:ubiquinone/menaquinone biosynthesis C-methylase UbiE